MRVQLHDQAHGLGLEKTSTYCENKNGVSDNKEANHSQKKHNCEKNAASSCARLRYCGGPTFFGGNARLNVAHVLMEDKNGNNNLVRSFP